MESLLLSIASASAMAWVYTYVIYKKTDEA